MTLEQAGRRSAMTPMRYPLLTWAACIALGALVMNAPKAETPAITTITVVPFTALGGEREAWLSKGISDLIMRRLAEVDTLAVLEREQLQAFLREMELQASGLFESDEALRVGTVAKVEQVIYGNYALERDDIAINLLAVDLETQEVFQRARVSGPLDALHDLVRTLTLDFLERREVALSEAERERMRFDATTSLAATQHFYRGIDHHDRGEHADAFGAFLAASQRDPSYHDAKLWMGRMLEALERPRLAVAAYRMLHRGAPHKVEGYDALLFGSALQEELDPERAIEGYRLLCRIQPPVPHSLEAAFRLGMLLESRGERLAALEALRRVDRLRAEVERRRPRKERGTLDDQLTPRFAHRVRQSRFLGWPQALGLYRRAIVEMTELYAELAERLPAEQLPTRPRGVYLIDPETPTISEHEFARTPALFHEQRLGNDWREAFYAVVMPRGHVATGATLEVSGRVNEVSSNVSYTMRVLPFPLPHNYENSWLGVIYGQTEKPARLSKFVPFYGRDQRVLTLQFVENRSEIRDWRLRVELRRAEPAAQREQIADVVPASGEAVKVGSVALPEQAFFGVTRPYYRYLYEPRHTLALARVRGRGLHLVAVRGELGGSQTDLWWTRSVDGDDWTRMRALVVNSQSDDFAPQLVQAEDGALRLFWLSDRRGRGWEIWTSELARAGERWTPARRVPLEQHQETGLAQHRGELATDLLHFGVTQDRRGRWLLAYQSRPAKQIVVLASIDAEQWHEVGRAPSWDVAYNPTLIEDRGGVYRMVAVGPDAHLHLWSSNDLVRWRHRAAEINDYWYADVAATHPMQLNSEAPGLLLLLLSDATYGLQHARFNPDTETPKLDLVKDVGLEPYAATALGDGRYLVVQRRQDEFEVRRYTRFHAPRNADNPRQAAIYVESTEDAAGRQWERIFARRRTIQPDVTTVGASPDGRIWWGIETGVMARKGEQFFFADVAKGFFHHYVTDIVPCGRRTAFASRFLDAPVLGFALPRNDARQFDLKSRKLARARGRVTALACGKGGRLLVGTGDGDVLTIKGTTVVDRVQIPGGVTALAAGPSAVWIGTGDGRLFRDLQPVALPDSAAGPVHALTVDADGQLWAAFGGSGLHRFDGRSWHQLAGERSGVPYRSIGAIAPDPRGGVWLIAHPQVRSSGLVHVHDSETNVYNPPDRLLHAPTGLSIGPDGDVWIGTAFDGVYKLERSSL